MKIAIFSALLLLSAFSQAAVVTTDLGYQPTSSADPEKSRPPTVEVRCSSQAEFFARVVASRQSGVAAGTIYSMAVDGDARSNKKQPSKIKSDWYRKTILAVYETPKYLYADPSAAGMRYEDSCKENPGIMLIDE